MVLQSPDIWVRDPEGLQVLHTFFFLFLTLLFRLLSLAQEGQGWLKEGTVARGLGLRISDFYN